MLEKKENKEEFIELCLAERCPRFCQYNPKTCIKVYKQDKCFRLYLSKLEKDQQKKIKKNKVKKSLKRNIKNRTKSKKSLNLDNFSKVRKKVFERDNYECQVWKILTPSEKLKIQHIDDLNLQALDPAHIIGKGRSRGNEALKNDTDNIKTICRFFHFRLDTYRDLISNKPMSAEEHENWLIRLVGSRENYEILKKKSKNS